MKQKSAEAKYLANDTRFIILMFWSNALAKRFLFHLNNGSPSRAATTGLRVAKIHRQRVLLAVQYKKFGLEINLSNGSLIYWYSQPK